MPCTICGEEGHSIKTCPLAAAHLDDASKRGQRDSPRTPGGEVSAKIAKLEGIQHKLSPSRTVPPLPTGSGAAASGDTRPGTTDEKLDKIMEMLNHVAVKDDLENMKVSMMREADANTKVLIAEVVDPLKSELHDLKGRVTVMEASGCPGAGDGGELQKSIEKSVAQLREQFEKATPESTPVQARLGGSQMKMPGPW